MLKRIFLIIVFILFSIGFSNADTLNHKLPRTSIDMQGKDVTDVGNFSASTATITNLTVSTMTITSMTVTGLSVTGDLVASTVTVSTITTSGAKVYISTNAEVTGDLKVVGTLDATAGNAETLDTHDS